MLNQIQPAKGLILVHWSCVHCTQFVLFSRRQTSLRWGAESVCFYAAPMRSTSICLNQFDLSDSYFWFCSFERVLQVVNRNWSQSKRTSFDCLRAEANWRRRLRIIWSTRLNSSDSAPIIDCVIKAFVKSSKGWRLAATLPDLLFASLNFDWVFVSSHPIPNTSIDLLIWPPIFVSLWLSHSEYRKSCQKACVSGGSCSLIVMFRRMFLRGSVGSRANQHVYRRLVAILLVQLIELATCHDSQQCI